MQSIGSVSLEASADASMASRSYSTFRQDEKKEVSIQRYNPVRK